jgi:hypothetical protein
MKWYLDNTRVTLIFYILFFGLSHFAWESSLVSKDYDYKVVVFVKPVILLSSI